MAKCPDCGKDHPQHPFKKPGMSLSQFTDRIAEVMEQMYQVGILLKDTENKQISHVSGKEESAYRISEKFTKKLDEHYRIQDEIEYLDKQRGIDSKTDFGGYDRDSYIIGITINDFVKLTPKDCKTCFKLVMTKRGDEDANEVMMKHMEKDHPEIYKAQQELHKYVKEWIILLQDVMAQNNKHREWRSK